MTVCIQEKPQILWSHHSFSMATSSIQVSEETRDRLARYKVGGMSYEDVLEVFMNLVEPEEFHEHYEDWQAEVARQIRRSEKWQPLDAD